MFRNLPEKLLLPEDQRKEKTNATRGSKEALGKPSVDCPLQPGGGLLRGHTRGELPRMPTPLGTQCSQHWWPWNLYTERSSYGG